MPSVPTAPRPPARDRCSASTVVNIGGICCAIKTGARSTAAGSFSIKAVSACGPPVEEPIKSTRGGTGENGRNCNGAASCKGVLRARSAGACLPCGIGAVPGVGARA